MVQRFAKSQEEVAAFFGVCRRTVAKWWGKGCPRRGGRYDLSAIAAWRESLRKPARERNPKAALECEKIDLENARRRLRLNHEQSRLVEREAMNAEIVQLFERVRSRLAFLPGELASSLPKGLRDDITADARNKLELILRELGTRDGSMLVG